MDARTIQVTTPAGEFVFTAAMTIRQQIRARRIAREIWGGDLPDHEDGEEITAEENLTAMLAELETACLQAPDGWVWAELTDMESVLNVWKEYREKRDSFRAGVEPGSVQPDAGGS